VNKEAMAHWGLMGQINKQQIIIIIIITIISTNNKNSV